MRAWPSKQARCVGGPSTSVWQRVGGPVHSGLEFGMRGGTIPKHYPHLGLPPTKVPNLIARLGTFTVWVARRSEM